MLLHQICCLVIVIICVNDKMEEGSNMTVICLNHAHVVNNGVGDRNDIVMNLMHGEMIA